jgi:hypothetical protein
MAEKEFNKLKDKKVALSQKVLKARQNIKNATRIVQDPKTSEDNRKKYLALLETYEKDLTKFEEEYDSTVKSVTEAEGDISVKGYQDKYAKLKRRLDLQLDPESSTAIAIEKEIDDLVPGFQSAYSKTVGTQVSPAVAKSKLVGTNVPTFAAPEGDVTPKTPGVETPPSAPSTPSAGGAGAGGAGAGGPIVPKKTKGQRREEAIDVAAEIEDFTLPETIFKNVPSLNIILKRYVDEEWTPSKLRKAIRDDVWYKQNSKEIKERYIQLYNYRDMVKTGQAQGTTQYEKDIATLTRQLENKAREIGSDAASDPDALRRAAENMYITDQGIEDSMTIDFLAASIRPVAGMIGGRITEGYSGQALKDYRAIQSIASANGFRVKDIVPGGQTEQQVLQGIATGKIDANRLAQDARKLAAQGQPQYVRELLGQGYNLDQVFAPYRQTMANLLEINENEIDLNDTTLRSAISDKGDMNLYDFKKTLKADKRWQYTENAKAEVSDITLKILRDFGFQG